jgi:hypothetical protein
MSRHVDVPESATRALVNALLELQRRLDPSADANYCAACDVPRFALGDDFAQRVEAAKAAQEAGNHIALLEDVGQAMFLLRNAIEDAVDDRPGDPAETKQLVDLYFRRVYFPVLLFMFRREWETGYMVLRALLYLDERAQEWFPDHAFPDRAGAVLCELLSRFGQASLEADEAEAESEGEAAELKRQWPVLVTDLVAVVALFYLVKLDKRPYFDFWFGYGWDPVDPELPSAAEKAAGRAVSFWWENHPETRVREENYQAKPVEAAGFERLGLSLIPIIEPEQGGPVLFPIPQGTWGGTQKLTEHVTLELTNAQISAAFGDIAAKLSADLPGFSLGNAKAEGPNAFLAIGKAELEVKAAYDLATPARNEISFVLRAKKAAFSVGNPGGSKLLARALPEGFGAEFDFGVGVRFAERNGGNWEWFWEGGIGLDYYAPLHFKPLSRKVVEIEIPQVQLTLAAKRAQKEVDGILVPSTKLAFETRAHLKLRVGPLTLRTDGLGFELALQRAPEDDGTLGPYDCRYQVLAPTAFGIQIASEGVFVGEGFIARDQARDRWIGALRLEIQHWRLEGVAMTEAGSFLAVLWAKNLGIATAIGTLEGLGVLVGCDRRGDREAILDGLRNGVLDTLLFPDDPVANAPTILATMGQLLPRAEGRTLVGIMVQWVFGERRARLVVAELGILLEFEGTSLRYLYLLGQGRVRLKGVPEHIFAINLEMFGVIDFERGEFMLRLTLRNSKLAGGDLSGDGLIFIDENRMVLSAGGFHPLFPVPGGLPIVQRLTCALVDSQHVRITLQAYLALTTCSFQVGGRLDVWAGAYGFSIEGLLAVDLLLRFNGEAVLDVAFSVALKRGNRVLASISFEGTLTGITVWSLSGRAKFKVLFLSVSVPIDYGSEETAAVRFQPADAATELRTALSAPESWSGHGRDLDFVLRDTAREGVWIAAHQGIRVSQNAVPLGERVERLGAAPLATPRTFQVEELRLGNRIQTTHSVEDDFAPGLYLDVDLEEALRAPQFERMQSGVRAEGSGLSVGEVVPGGSDYEQVVVDEPASTLETDLSVVAVTADSAETPVWAFYRVAARPVRVTARRFLVADQTLAVAEGLQPSQIAGGLTYSQARFLRRRARTTLQVVRQHEVSLR